MPHAIGKAQHRSPLANVRSPSPSIITFRVSYEDPLKRLSTAPNVLITFITPHQSCMIRKNSIYIFVPTKCLILDEFFFLSAKCEKCERYNAYATQTTSHDRSEFFFNLWGPMGMIKILSMLIELHTFWTTAGKHTRWKKLRRHIVEL